MTIMAKKKKKKGRPSLLDLKKRSLKQQLLLQRQSPNFFDFSPNPSGRSNLRYGGGGVTSTATEFIAGADDDERKEKKHRLVLGLNSDPEANRATLSLNSSVAFGSDSNADGECDDSDIALKRHKVSDVVHGSNHTSGKGLKATENSIVHGSQVESGPTATPLPDKKLLVFILDRLQKKDTYGVFSDPVDPEELPDYHEIIENPMDFGTVRKKLDCGAYSNLEQFENDVLLICSNAMEYNSPDTIYFRQARSIQELAKKDFENLREESDDSDPPPLKIVKRGRPPGKKIKKYTESYPFECVGPESFLNTTLPLAEETEHHDGTNSYNLRKNPTSNKFRSANAEYGSFRVSLGTDSYPSCVYDWESEFPASVVRSVQKYGMKHFSVDENKRDAYKFPSASGDESSTLALLEAEQKQLVEVGDACMGRSYARSLARFAENLGPVARKFALNKIESVWPTEFMFGTVESEVSQNQESFFLEQKKSLPNTGADDLACRFFPQSAIGSNSIPGSSNQSELASFNSKVGGIRPITPFQIRQNSALQPCTSISNKDHLSHIPTQMGRSQPQIPVPPLMLGIVSNESDLLTNANRIDSGNFSPQGTALVSYQAPDFGTVRDASLQQWTMQYNQLDSQPFLSDANAAFWTPDSPSSVVQIGSPQQPDLALQLRMGW